MPESDSRAEHVRWAKARAFDELDADGRRGPALAMASLTSDLGKHPETRDLVDVCVYIGHPLLEMNGPNLAGDIRDFITGLSE